MSDEEKLEEAALNLKQVGDTSVPVILNIIGNKKSDNSDHTLMLHLVLIWVFHLDKTSTVILFISSIYPVHRPRKCKKWELRGGFYLF